MYYYYYFLIFTKQNKCSCLKIFPLTFISWSYTCVHLIACLQESKNKFYDEIKKKKKNICRLVHRLLRQKKKKFVYYINQ